MLETSQIYVGETILHFIPCQVSNLFNATWVSIGSIIIVHRTYNFINKLRTQCCWWLYLIHLALTHLHKKCRMTGGGKITLNTQIYSWQILITNQLSLMWKRSKFFFRLVIKHCYLFHYIQSWPSSGSVPFTKTKFNNINKTMLGV